MKKKITKKMKINYTVFYYGSLIFSNIRPRHLKILPIVDLYLLFLHAIPSRKNRYYMLRKMFLYVCMYMHAFYQSSNTDSSNDSRQSLVFFIGYFFRVNLQWKNRKFENFTASFTIG